MILTRLPSDSLDTTRVVLALGEMPYTEFVGEDEFVQQPEGIGSCCA